jgi:hypothetical protein
VINPKGVAMWEALAQLIVGIAGLCGFVTICGTLILRWRLGSQVPVKTLAFVCFWATLRVLIAISIGTFIYTFAPFPIPHVLSSLISIAALCVIGWLITRDLVPHGIPAKFPGAGAKAMFGMLVISWVVVGVWWALTPH